MNNPDRVTFLIMDEDAEFVQIKVSCDKPTVINCASPTEEGYICTSEIYTYDKETGEVFLHVETDGTDCDGSIQTSYTFTCPIGDLTKGTIEGLSIPIWTRVDSSQRYYESEKEGY